MPDCHSFCTDVQASLEEFSQQTDMCMQTGVDLNLDFEVIFRATEDFFEENKEWMFSIASKFQKPILLEILPELYKEGWEYVNSELYIRVIYNFMNSDEDSLMRLTINLNKNELTKSIVITTNMSKEPSENNLDIQM